MSRTSLKLSLLNLVVKKICVILLFDWAILFYFEYCYSELRASFHSHLKDPDSIVYDETLHVHTNRQGILFRGFGWLKS